MKITHNSNRYIRVLLCMLMLLLGSGQYMAVQADESDVAKDPNHYETWLQTVYSREEGLAVGTANTIATTSDGIIWIGTYAGLYRYNGSKFQLMNQYESVKSVECLYVDDQDRLWVGTNDRGISIFQHEELIGELHMEDGLPSDAVRSIVQAADGLYYIGTSDNMAVVRFDQEAKVVGTVDEITYADRITADKDGNVVATSSYGKIYLLRDGAVVAEKEIDDADRFTACVFDVSGHVYAGTSLGNIYTYDISKQDFQEVYSVVCDGVRKINNLIRINEHTIFVCADNGIGYFAEDHRFHHLETKNFNSNIYNVIKDYQGNLWFASSRMGLLRLCKTSFVEMFTEYSVDPAVVNSIERYHDLLYIGSDGGLIVIDEENHQTVEDALTDYLRGVRIRKILKDSNDHLWFCTYGEGLVVYDGKEIQKIDEGGENIGGRVRAALELADGKIAVSSEVGVALIQDGQVEKLITEKDGLKNLINLCMLEKEDGTLLIGSDGDGIAELRDGQVKIVGVEDGLPSGVILRMIKDVKGDGIFVVTSNSLCYLNADNTVTPLNHFPYSNNFDIVQQDNMVFVLGSAGIYVLQHDELLSNSEKMRYTYLDSRAGLQAALVANSWGLYEQGKEKVYLPTSTGVTLFDLAEYDDRPSDFVIRVASAVIDGREVNFEDGISLGFSENVRRLEIKPEIINYSTVDPVIRCTLNGFDREPIVMPQSELSPVVYTNLPAGKYTFSMDLIDAESGVSISKRVYYLERETAFTETVWFYVLAILLLFLLATIIGLIAAKRSYNRNMAKKSLESRIYLDALQRNATFLYYFDLTEGYLTTDIGMNHDYSALEKLGLSLPVAYDAFRQAYYERMQIHTLENSEDKICREDLLKSFNEGRTSIATEYYSARYNQYHRNMIYMTRRESDGHVIAVVVGSDITEQRKVEETKRKELQDAYDQAKQANRAKTDFLSRMSHDIRTPINGIVGMVHVMEKQLDHKEKVDDSLQKIKMLSRQLELLINDVLEMSRIESGKIELAHETFVLEDVLHEMRPALDAMAENREVLLTGSHYDIQHKIVVGSPIHLQRILMNILSNAVKYNRARGSIECWLTEIPVDETHSNYELKVKDTGIGMSDEFVQKIFDPFSREQRKDDIQGTGLGMAITKELVDKFGGTIEVESTLNAGTTFTVTLPLEFGREEAIHHDEQETISLDHKRILVVDDNELNLDVIQFILEEEHVEIELARNGLEAVGKFKASPCGYYDIVLMDVMMPVMNGLEAARVIRALEREDAGTVPIIAMTANAFAEDVKQCLDAGMTAHIAKPINPDKILSEIARQSMKQTAYRTVHNH